MKKKLFTLFLVPIGFIITILLSFFTLNIILGIFENSILYILFYVLLTCAIIISLIALKISSKNKLQLTTFDFIVCTELPSVLVSIFAFCWHINTTQETNYFVVGFEFLIFFLWLVCSVLTVIITIIASAIIHNKNKTELMQDE